MTSSHPECLNPKAAATFGPTHDMQEVRGEHKGNMLSVYAQKLLCVAQDMAKINVEQVPCKVRDTKALDNLGHLLMPSGWLAHACRNVSTVVCDHDVVIMPVSYAQHIRGHAVTSAGLDESLHGCVVLQSGNNHQPSYNFCYCAEDNSAFMN